MDTLPPVEVLPSPLPLPPPTVESISVGTEADLEILYSRDVALGLEPATLLWGLSIGDIVQYLLDFPTLHVDNVLRRILLDPRYPRGTQRHFFNRSTVIHTAQDVLRNVAQRCVTSIKPVRHILDRSDRTRAQVKNSVAHMLDAQAARTIIPTFVNPPVVDLTETPDDGGQPDPAQCARDDSDAGDETSKECPPANRKKNQRKLEQKKSNICHRLSP